ncbi:MAG TPA: STAS domain-containing protein [Bacteroidota bacterium]|nr:STAS domain-containing protein [Bacteroidota bacterium]
MKFVTKKNGTETILKLQGKKLDASIAPDLKGEILVLCKAKKLIIDLTAVEFCDSSGLSALLLAERKMRETGGTVQLVGVQKKVLSLMKISHLDQTFHMFDTLAKAAKG